MTRVLINKDPANKSVTYKQGLRVMTAYLDPWPDTDEEIEAQAYAKLPAYTCLLYTSPSPRDKRQSRMPSSA